MKAAISDALQSERPTKAEEVFSLLFDSTFSCQKVLEETPDKFVYLAERVGLKYDGLPVRIELSLAPHGTEVTGITVDRLDVKETP